MPVDCSSNRVPSGIPGLDEVIGGGFPRGGLFIVAGSPGTGKTIFSATFLYSGATQFGERGIYVSFAEGRDDFYRNMRGLGMDFEKLEKAGDFKFLDMITVREEAIPTILETILSELGGLGARRLVVDSFSALVQAIRERHDVRIMLHTLLNKITKSLGCTAILTVEIPYGEEKIGLGIEEFVADGIFMLRRSGLEGGRIIRDLEIFKMRGTPTPETNILFTLGNGFKAFPPFRAKPVERPRRFNPIPDTEEYFSTGSMSLDEMLGGGYPRGSTVLVEIADEHISMRQYHLVVVPTIWNFITRGRGVIITPSRGPDHNIVRMRAEEGGISKEEIMGLLRVCVEDYPGLRPEPYVVVFKGENLREDHEKYLEIERELVEKTGQPVFCIVGLDTLIDIYGLRDTLSITRASATTVREKRGLLMLILKPGYPRLAKLIGALADIHLKVTRKYGVVLVYGMKPRTGPHILEMDTSMGYPMPELTPIM